ncbi:MAG: hypothetical protein ABIP45_05270 [Knoellia sp.]
MSMARWTRRALVTGVGAVGALAFGISSASAHHCFIPMYSLNGPTSANWFVVSAELGAQFEHEYVAKCDAAVDAGYAALKAAKLPVGVKLFEKMTIGDPKETGRMNPNGANNVGLEYFGAGSELPFQMVDTWMAAAETTNCG